MFLKGPEPLWSPILLASEDDRSGKPGVARSAGRVKWMTSDDAGRHGAERWNEAVRDGNAGNDDGGCHG